MILHAGLVALRLDGLWTGALIQGPSGAGKSDLALRALETGFRLVADDRTELWTSGGDLYGRAPDTISSLIEVRGLDVVRQTALPLARIALVIRCVSDPATPQRLANGERVGFLGINLPVLELWPFEPSAPLKLRRSLWQIGQVGQGAYQASLAAHTLP